jgi:hypothetical protein
MHSILYSSEGADQFHALFGPDEGITLFNRKDGLISPGCLSGYNDEETNY